MVWLSYYQFPVELGKPKENLKRVWEIRDRLPKGGLFLLPEMFCCGFDYQNMENLASRAEEFLTFLAELSSHTKGVVVGTLPLKREDGIYNTAAVFDKGKLLAQRGKIKLFPLYKEPKHFKAAPSSENRVIETSVGKIGVVICYEVRFNEITNQLRREGVVILLVPAMWGIERRDHFKVLTRARAVETQSFLVAANAWGQSGKTFFGGASAIYSPWGEVLSVSYDGTSLGSAKVDLSQVEKVRKKLPVEF